MYFYEILNVDMDATDAQIRSAYRQAAVKYHPDKNRDNTVDAEMRFKKVVEAYETLIDPAKRKKYDSTCHSRHIHAVEKNYDVDPDEMGMIIHNMSLHNLASFDDAFDNVFSARNHFADLV